MKLTVLANTFGALVLVFTLIGCACGTSEDASQPPASAEPALIASAPAPSGTTMERMAHPTQRHGAMFPKEEGWKVETGKRIVAKHDEKGIYMSVFAQHFVAPEKRDSYTDSYIANNERDAPKFELVNRKNGSVNGHPASRMVGAFDNGKKQTTRDYLIFAEGSVYIVGGRAPQEHADALNALVDHAASTFSTK